LIVHAEEITIFFSGVDLMNSKGSKLTLAGAIASVLAACGGGGSSATSPTATPSAAAAAANPATKATVSMLISDASTEDWSTIGVKVLSITLVPQSGGPGVTVYTAPAAVPVVNLVQLDQLGELLGNATVPAGTYKGAVLTVSANPGDVLLNVAADPEPGFAGTPGAAIPADQIQIQHTRGTAPNLTVPVAVTFDSPLVVSATQNNQVDLEFDLAHPAFIIGHVPVGSGTTIWAVNFDGPVRHHPVADIAHLVLRHLYGSVASISSDDSAITVTKEFPTEPAVNPETAVPTTQSVQILADPINGTAFYDVDAKTKTIIKDFSSETSLVGKSVRIAARYQEDGTLVATRLWASTQFNNVWVSPEGHVLHVNGGDDVVTIENERGVGVPMLVNANTEFFFRTPADAVADGKPIVTGTGFLTSHDLVRGFKVHASVVDPLAKPLVAQTIDIETAAYDGEISAADLTGFTYTRNFRTQADDYVFTLDYIASTTANGNDASDDPVLGYKYWNFAYPTLVTSGTSAIPDFVAATEGAVNFGGSVGPVPSYGRSYAVWGDPANANGWAAAATSLEPLKLPLGLVATGLVNDVFTMTVNGGTTAANVAIGTESGSATLVYQVDRTNGVVSVSPIDVTTTAGLATLTAALTAGVPVKVYGVPESNATLRAYVLTYFTGEAPAQ
jgi:hypothetical protein